MVIMLGNTVGFRVEGDCVGRIVGRELTGKGAIDGWLIGGFVGASLTLRLGSSVGSESVGCLDGLCVGLNVPVWPMDAVGAVVGNV